MLLTSWSGTGSGHSFDAMPLWVAGEPPNGGGFHLIAGVWNTNASKHSAAKRVQDSFVEGAGWDGHRSSLLQGLVDSLYNPFIFIKGSEAPHLFGVKSA